MSETKAMTVQAPYSLEIVRPVATAADVVGAHKAVTELIQGALVEGEDYGVIPGTERKDKNGRDISKRVLLKPGAERLCIAFGVTPEFQILEQEVDHDRLVKFTKRRWEWGKQRGEKVWHTEEGESFGLYRYVVKCRLVRPDGRVLAEGISSCSTMEGKYIERPRDSENTVLKMATKRAHVAATLTMGGLSDRFTQDVEEHAPPRDEAPAGSVRPPGAASEKGTEAPGSSRDSTGGQSQDHDPKTGEVRCSGRAQWAKIYAKAKEAGYKDKTETYVFVEKTIGHEITDGKGQKSMSVLTYDEAEQVYAALSKLVGYAGPPGPPEPPPPSDEDVPF